MELQFQSCAFQALYHLRKLNSQILALNLALTRMTGARARARLRARVQTISKISLEYVFLD